MLLDFSHHVRFDQCISFALLTEFHDDMATNIGSHDNDGVGEVHGAALTISETAIIKHLQQHVTDVRMCLLKFVKEHHAIRTTTYRLSKTAAFFVPNISRRRTNQSSHRVLLHELTHVDSDHGGFGIKEIFSKRFAQLGLTNARWPKEQERTNRAA